MNNSELVFSTAAINNETGKKESAELYMVKNEGEKPFFVSNNEDLIRESLAEDAFNPFSENRGPAARLLMMIGAFGFKQFEE